MSLALAHLRRLCPWRPPFHGALLGFFDNGGADTLLLVRVGTLGGPCGAFVTSRVGCGARPEEVAVAYSEVERCSFRHPMP